MHENLESFIASICFDTVSLIILVLIVMYILAKHNMMLFPMSPAYSWTIIYLSFSHWPTTILICVWKLTVVCAQLGDTHDDDYHSIRITKVMCYTSCFARWDTCHPVNNFTMSVSTRPMWWSHDILICENVYWYVYRLVLELDLEYYTPFPLSLQSCRGIMANL